MKKFKLVAFSVVVITAMLLSACGTADFSNPEVQPAEQIFAPGDTNTGGSVEPAFTDARPTLRDQYEKCINSIDLTTPEMEVFLPETLYGGEAALLWKCGEPVVAGGEVLFLVGIEFITKITPTKADDVTIHGIVFVKSAGKFFILLAGAYAAAYAAGQVDTTTAIGLEGTSGLPWESHTDPTHNPNKLGSLARTLIAAAMGLFTATGGPGPEHKCGVVKNTAGMVIRAFIWIADATLPEGGYTAWYFVNSNRGPWGGAYPKTQADFETAMNRNDHPEWSSESTNCDDPNFPSPPTYLQAGQ
ncbi:MAG: hypothetical protein UW68_C0016G0032 [Candidatus Collierbacteria bacterium GW2011_GWB1_44_6]|uniref:Uncharacterized protein n=1 Tax=Candidatus Collierbacteria bacterium GW2011_GWB1_44_6 TaxID=1618384 RepID=A0A0G1LWG1_9BACT|nr:MAG: hypothetical protein UW68_C0016G0032 [Candidatus Collierbacteria bacterium GW2011_GWB1_44_6]